LVPPIGWSPRLASPQHGSTIHPPLVLCFKQCLEHTHTHEYPLRFLLLHASSFDVLLSRHPGSCSLEVSLTPAYQHGHTGYRCLFPVRVFSCSSHSVIQSLYPHPDSGEAGWMALTSSCPSPGRTRRRTCDGDGIHAAFRSLNKSAVWRSKPGIVGTQCSMAPSRLAWPT
jgi:hypothetical protein